MGGPSGASLAIDSGAGTSTGGGGSSGSSALPAVSSGTARVAVSPASAKDILPPARVRRRRAPRRAASARSVARARIAGHAARMLPRRCARLAFAAAAVGPVHAPQRARAIRVERLVHVGARHVEVRDEAEQVGPRALRVREDARAARAAPTAPPRSGRRTRRRRGSSRRGTARSAPGIAARPSASRRAFAWSSASRARWCCERVQPRRGEHARLAHAAAEPLAEAARVGDEVARARHERARRRAEPLRQAHRDGRRLARVLRRRDPGRGARVPEARAVEVDVQARAAARARRGRASRSSG